MSPSVLAVPNADSGLTHCCASNSCRGNSRLDLVILPGILDANEMDEAGRQIDHAIRQRPTCFHQTRPSPLGILCTRRQKTTGRSSTVRTAKLLERDHTFIESFVVLQDDLLLLSFTDDDTSITPTKVVHTPEGIDGQEERINWIPKSP